MFIFLQKGKKMKKNIMLLFGLFLGASNINCITVSVQEGPLSCLLDKIVISDVLETCGDTVNAALATYPNYDVEALARSVASDKRCLSYLSGKLIQFRSCGNLIKFS
jgi:hypothetical protein